MIPMPMLARAWQTSISKARFEAREKVYRVEVGNRSLNERRVHQRQALSEGILSRIWLIFSTWGPSLRYLLTQSIGSRTSNRNSVRTSMVMFWKWARE
jgi:hypothetical protein